MFSGSQHYEYDDDPQTEVDLSHYVSPLYNDPGGDDYSEYTNLLGDGYDFDEEPLGDIEPYSEDETKGIVYNGRYYTPMKSTNDYDMYHAKVTPDFDDTTTNQEQYGWKTAPSYRHENGNEPMQTLPRFSAETTNKSTYLPHIIKKTSLTKVPTEKVPFLSNDPANQLHVKTVKPTKQRSKTYLNLGDNEFDNDTTNKSTYKSMATEKPVRYEANDHLGVGGTFFANTINATEFQKHGVKKVEKQKLSVPKLQQDAFNDFTTTSQVYTPKKGEKDCVAAKVLAAHNKHKLVGSYFNNQGHLMLPKLVAIKAGAKESQFKKMPQIQPFKSTEHYQNAQNKTSAMPNPSFDIYEATSQGNYTPPPVVFSSSAGTQPQPINNSTTMINYGKNEPVDLTRQ